MSIFYRPILTALTLGILSAGAFGQSLIGWGGLYVSVARTTPIAKQTFNRRDFNIEATAIFPIRKSKFAFQLELIQSLSGGQPVLRIAIARRIF